MKFSSRFTTKDTTKKGVTAKKGARDTDKTGDNRTPRVRNTSRVRNSEGKLASKRGQIAAFTCGECIHYKQVPLPGHDSVCSKEGVRAGATAPACYVPDASRLMMNGDQFAMVASFVGALGRAEKRILFGLLNSKGKYPFGSKVYFNAGTADYLNNYVAGYVVGNGRGIVMVMGDPDAKKRGSPYIAYLQDDSNLLNSKQFLAKKKQLIKAGKIDDSKKNTKPIPMDLEYEPPTIDSDLGKRIKRKRTDAVDTRLTEFVVQER